MAEFTIKLVFNLRTGKTDVHIDYESDPDALPIEHEREHRALIGDLLGQGILAEGDLGEVVVQRGRQAAAPARRQEDASGPESLSEDA